MSLDLAIVTSCHNYGRYIVEWAESLTKLRTRPVRVCIVDNGSTDTSPAEIAKAVRLLEGAGLEVRHERIAYTDFGSARNAAVELAGDVEWVQHFDCDDLAMPHMLCDVAELAPKSDVVALGYERCGDLAAGPRNRTRVYSDSQGRSTLRSKAPASGVSPFRRALWLRSPYRTDMAGGWDTALWLGFAHMGARFRATRRPCFRYRQHADSVFNVRRLSDWKTKLVGRKLNALRNGAKGVTVVIPWRPDGGARDRAADWIEARYRALYPDWQVLRGTCAGAWNKGMAVASALDDSTGLTLIVADADCALPAEALTHAVSLVQSGAAPWVVPHTTVHRLDEPSTDAILALDPTTKDFAGEMVRAPYRGFAGGGCVVVDRGVYEAVGGIPMCFEGWGAEDEALALVLDTLVGEHVRLEHDLWHLYHPQSRTARNRHYRTNRAIYGYMGALASDPVALWDLVQRIARGESPTGGARRDRVLMVATRDYQEGRVARKEGDIFHATETEARRHEARPTRHRLARRYTGNPLAAPRRTTTTQEQRAMLNRRERLAADRERRRLEHERRNRVAVEMERQDMEARRRERDEQRARRKAEHALRNARGGTSGVKMIDGAAEDKMMRPDEFAAEDKAEGGADDALAAVSFASDVAEGRAREAGLTAADFVGMEPSGVSGFTSADVRRLVGG